MFESPRAGRAPSLDGARGVLAAVVTAAHFSAAAGGIDLLPLARASVLGFFLISSYSLALSWREADYLAFVVKRLTRLWPCYAAALAFGALVTGLRPSLGEYFWLPYKPSWAEFPQDPPLWSLYVEVYASLAMPAFVALGRGTARAILGAAALCALAAWHRDFLYGVLFVAGAWAAPRIRIDIPILDTKPAQWLGAISYPLYLFHVEIIVSLKRAAPALWFWIALPAALALAAGLTTLLEQPSKLWSRRLGRLIAGRGRAEVAATPV